VRPVRRGRLNPIHMRRSTLSDTRAKLLTEDKTASRKSYVDLRISVRRKRRQPGAWKMITIDDVGGNPVDTVTRGSGVSLANCHRHWCRSLVRFSRGCDYTPRGILTVHFSLSVAAIFSVRHHPNTHTVTTLIGCCHRLQWGLPDCNPIAMRVLSLGILG
jgi:hypothetical protein